MDPEESEDIDRRSVRNGLAFLVRFIGGSLALFVLLALWFAGLTSCIRDAFQ